MVTSIFAPGVVRLDPDTSEPSRTINVDNEGSVDTIEAAGSIWISHGSRNVVVRIDPTP